MFLGYLAIYVSIGVAIAGDAMAKGRIGSSGVLPSFLFQTAFWPLFALLRL